MATINTKIWDSYDSKGAVRIVSDKKFTSSQINTTEYILNKDTNYYLEIINNDGGTLSITINWFWVLE